MKEIAIVGCSGAGKSTLVEKLSMALDIPVYHIDLVIWTDNWGHLTEEEFEPYHNQLLDNPEWIIDGVVNENSMRTRFRSADTIIFMDVPPEVCKQRALKRMEEDKVVKNPFMAEGCRYNDVHSLQMEVIDKCEFDLKPLSLSLLYDYTLEPVGSYSNGQINAIIWRLLAHANNLLFERSF